MADFLNELEELVAIRPVSGVDFARITSSG